MGHSKGSAQSNSSTPNRPTQPPDHRPERPEKTRRLPSPEGPLVAEANTSSERRREPERTQRTPRHDAPGGEQTACPQLGTRRTSEHWLPAGTLKPSPR